MKRGSGHKKDFMKKHVISEQFLHTRLGEASLLLFSLTMNLFCYSLPPVENVAIQKNDYTALKSHLSAAAKDLMNKKNIKGLSLAVVDDQKIVYSDGFGYAVKSAGVKTTPETLFCVGSAGKLFTAIAVMKLAEEGKIDIDKPLKTYLQEFSIKSRYRGAPEITIRHILTHHSGLPEGRAKGFVQGFLGTQVSEKNDDPYNSYHNLSRLLKEEYTASPPNTIFAYSNLGYSILGEVVTRVSKMDFEDYVKREILDPIGMKESTFVPAEANPELLSRGYLNGREIGIPLIRDIPAGQMVTSADEMARFIMMLLNGGSSNGTQIIKSATLSEMFRIQNGEAKKDGDFKIALGFWIHPAGEGMPNGRGHGGDLPPFHALLTIIPEKKIGAVAMVNTLSSSMDLANIVNPALRLALETKTGEMIAPVKSAHPVKLAGDSLKKYEGIYATPMGPVKIRTVGGGHELNIVGTTLRAAPYSDGSFRPYLRLFGLIPIHLVALEPLSAQFVNAGAEQRLQLSAHGLAAFGTSGQITPQPVNRRWMERIGKYEALNQDVFVFFKTFALRYDGKSRFFFFDIGLNRDFLGGKKLSIPIDTINDHEAVGMGDGRNLGETIRVTVENGDEIINYSGFRLRRKK